MRHFITVMFVFVIIVVAVMVLGDRNSSAQAWVAPQSPAVVSSSNPCQIKVSDPDFTVRSYARAYDNRTSDGLEEVVDEKSSYDVVDTTLSTSASANSGNVSVNASASGSIEYQTVNGAIDPTIVGGARLTYSTDWNYSNTSTWPNMALYVYGSYSIGLRPETDGVIEIRHSASSSGDFVGDGAIAWLLERPWLYDPVPANGSGIVTKTVEAGKYYTMRFASVQNNSPVGAVRDPFSGGGNTTFEWRFIPGTAQTDLNGNGVGLILFTDYNDRSTTDSLVADPALTINSIETLHRSVAGGGNEWIPTTETVDGNTIRVAVDISNDAFTGTAQLAFFNAQTDELIGTMDDLTFPEGTDTEINFDWSTSGQAWDSAYLPRTLRIPIKAVLSYCNVDAQGVDEATAAGLLVKPKPVILVHGLWSNDGAWDAYLGDGFLHDAHPNWSGWAVDTMYTGDQFGNPYPINTIRENAQLLSEYIQYVRQSLNAWHVDIVAHSMGALISRNYIDALMPTIPFDEYVPVVSHLVMLGAPNEGSPCAAQFGFLFASIAELHPLVMVDFNWLVTNRKGVEFSNFVGDLLPFTCASLVRGDGVVPLSSARWDLYPEQLQEGAVLHTSMTSNTNIFENYVLPRLSSRHNVSSNLASWSASHDDTVAHEKTAALDLADPQLLVTEAVQIPATSIQDINVTVADSTAFGVTVSAVQSIGVQLIDPASNIIDEIPAFSPGADELFRSFRVETPMLGNWTIRMDNQGAESGDSAVTAWIEGSPVNLDLQELVENSGAGAGQLGLAATLVENGRAVIDATLTATVSDFEGNLVTVALFDDGLLGDSQDDDGIYSAAVELPGGLYSIGVRAEGSDFVRYTTGVAWFSNELNELYLPFVNKKLDS